MRLTLVFVVIIVGNPLFVPRYNMSLAEERELALQRLQAVCNQKYFSVRDFLTYA